MRKSNFRTLVIVGPLLAVAVIFFFIYAGHDNSLTNAVSLQDTSVDNLSEHATEDKSSGNTRVVPPQPASVERKALVADFSYITPEYLETHWEAELGCFNLQEGNETQCEYPELSASSYEEAMWMIENGYPPASVLTELESLSDAQLKNLSRNRQYWLPPLLLAQRYAASGDRLEASKYFLRSEGRNMNPYGFQRRAKSLVVNPDPDQPAWSYRTAAVNFKKAALLGDYTAEDALYELIDSFWNGRMHFSLSNDIAETAYWELGRRFGLPIDQWPIQKRPKGG